MNDNAGPPYVTHLFPFVDAKIIAGSACILQFVFENLYLYTVFKGDFNSIMIKKLQVEGRDVIINEKTELWTVILWDSQYFHNKALKDYKHLHCIVNEQM